MPQSYSPFPLTASVSTEAGLHGLGEVPLHGSPCTAPPVWESPAQAWKELRPSLADLQTKQAIWPSGQSSSTAGRLPVLPVVQTPVPVKDLLRTHPHHGRFTHTGPKGKLASSTARLCLLMKTHPEPLGATGRRLSATSCSAGPSFAWKRGSPVAVSAASLGQTPSPVDFPLQALKPLLCKPATDRELTDWRPAQTRFLSTPFNAAGRSSPNEGLQEHLPKGNENRAGK